jgi:hypothetical protein
MKKKIDLYANTTIKHALHFPFNDDGDGYIGYRENSLNENSKVCLVVFACKSDFFPVERCHV